MTGSETSSRRRSRSDFESDDPENDSLDDISPDSHGSARKRSRLSNGTTLTSPGSPSSNEAQVPNGAFGGDNLQARPTRKNHLPGSIVRVKLTDFVTYKAAEFFPGPSLNMVIGPNGTGKSTLVCAICLGLGWPTSTLGRAKEVGEFVKHGAQEAIVEIELAKDGKRFKRNLIIQCTIKRDGNKSVFKVNGKPQGKKIVLEVVRSLNIQIDNLCQFLPQDKVVEFAAMTPIELLRSTQRAVATQEMIDTHESLKKRGGERKIVQDSLGADQESMANLEGRQRLQAADVEQMREREQVVHRVSMLEKARPTTRYRTAKDKFNEAKTARRTKQQEYDSLKAEVEPSLRAMKAKELYSRRINAVSRQRREAVTSAEQSADGMGRDFQALQDKHVRFENAQRTEKEAYKAKKKDILKHEGRLRELRVQEQHRPPDVDAAAFNEQLRAKQTEINEASRATNVLKRRQEELTRDGRECGGEIKDAERALKQLDSQAGRQSSKLQNLSPDTAKLWQWVQENSDYFEKEVFGPPAISCSIKEPKYADMIESLFQRGLMLSFTVQTKKDFSTLSEVAHEKLGLSEINSRFIPFGLSQFQASLSQEDMDKFGFDGLALDFLNGPQPVLAMLCAEVKLHETGIAFRDTSSHQFQLIQQSNVQYWVTQKSTYRISRRREYGPGATSTQTRQIRKAVIWTDRPVDQSTKQPILDKIRNLEERLDGYKHEIAEAQATIREKRTIISDRESEYKELQHEKSEQQKAAGEYKALPTKIANQESRIQAIKDEIAGFTDRIREHSQKQDDIAMERAQKALDYAEAVEKLRSAHFELHEAELLSIEAESDLSVLQSRNAEVNQLLENYEKEVESCERQTNMLRQEATRCLKLVQDMLAQDDGESIREFLQTLPTDQTMEDLESEIESEKGRLELMREGNGNTIREFEQRKKRIEQLSIKVKDEKHALTELEAAIAELRNQWEPALDTLVGKISSSFSENMEQIGCAGEVSVHKDDDFDQWAIEIRVKFRENEPLTILNAHRQSGGERAVSTIFYLMSLQSLTPSPFRVVDEINQGMDPKNERLVHKRMVDIACGQTNTRGAPPRASPSANDDDDDGAGSQYFLITPKLLPDLAYARGMRVLCIASGEYMPEEAKTVDFKRAIEIKRGLVAGMDGNLTHRGIDSLGGGNRVGVAAG